MLDTAPKVSISSVFLFDEPWPEANPAALDANGRHQLARRVMDRVSPAMQHVIDEYRRANRDLLAMWERGVSTDSVEWLQKSAEATAVGGWLPSDVRVAVIYAFAPEYQDTFF